MFRNKTPRPVLTCLVAAASKAVDLITAATNIW